MGRITYLYEETGFNGSRGVLFLTTEDCTKAEADAKALRMGWKPPRWWQWWRWNDQPRRVEVQP